MVGTVAEYNHSLMERKQKGGRGRSGVPHPLSGACPSNLENYHEASPFKESTAFQQCHGLGTKPIAHGCLGDISDPNYSKFLTQKAEEWTLMVTAAEKSVFGNVFTSRKQSVGRNSSLHFCLPDPIWIYNVHFFFFLRQHLAILARLALAEPNQN